MPAVKLLVGKTNRRKHDAQSIVATVKQLGAPEGDELCLITVFFVFSFFVNTESSCLFRKGWKDSISGSRAYIEEPRPFPKDGKQVGYLNSTAGNWKYSMPADNPSSSSCTPNLSDQAFLALSSLCLRDGMEVDLVTEFGPAYWLR